MKRIVAIFVICLGVFVLAGCGGSDSSDSGSAPAGGENPGNVYRVITIDESGAPVEGTMVQFCSDQMCIMGETDADGIAVFEQDEGGMYTVKVYAVPEGFAEDKTEYPAPESYGDVNITLKAAETAE